MLTRSVMWAFTACVALASGCAVDGTDDSPDDPSSVSEASSSGCTLAPYGLVCFNVHGSGLDVNDFGVVRDKADPSMICDYKSSVTAYYPNGSHQTWWSPYHQGCTPLRAWFSFTPPNVPSTYPDQTKVCGSFFEKGERQGTACEKIHK